MTTKTRADYSKDYTQPKLREQLKEIIKKGSKGAASGKWSARKSQLLKAEYEKAGGGYKHSGYKTEAQNSLTKWSKKN